MMSDDQRWLSGDARHEEADLWLVRKICYCTLYSSALPRQSQVIHIYIRLTVQRLSAEHCSRVSKMLQAARRVYAAVHLLKDIALQC